MAILFLFTGCDNQHSKKYYDKEGKIKYEAVYDGKKRVLGICYDGKGVPWKKIKYKDGKIISNDCFYENGNLKGSFSYVDGKRMGPVTGYYSNGKVYSKANYKSGRLDGKAYLFYPDGSVLLNYGYNSKKGDPDIPDYRDGDYIYYDRAGKIISKGFFKREIPWSGTFMSSYKNFVGDIFAESILTYMLEYDKGKLIKSYRMKVPFKYPLLDKNITKDQQVPCVKSE